MRIVWKQWIAVGIAVAGMAPLAFAAGQSPSRAPEVSGQDVARITGSVREVDLVPPGRSLQVASTDGKVLTVTLDPDTTAVRQNGQQVNLDHLKVGQTVEVRTMPKDGKPMAQMIEIKEKLAGEPGALAGAIGSVQGTIHELDLDLIGGRSVRIREANGQIAQLELDPDVTIVWQGGQKRELDQLAIGQSVEARFMTKDGQQFAQSIDIRSAFNPSPAPSEPASRDRAY